MFEILFSKVKLLLKNPMFVFVYGIMSKWYIAVLLTASVVTFWVFKGLSDAGVIKNAEDIVFRAFKESKAVARYCVPKITNLGDFWNCLESPPEYVETEDEKRFQTDLEGLGDPDHKSSEDDDPYDKF